MTRALPSGERGRRLGWIAGATGALSWLLPLFALALWRGQNSAACVAMGAFMVGVVYLWICAPWRFPHRPFALVYLGLVLIVIVAAVVLLWLMATPSMDTGRLYAMLLPLLALFVPLVIFGRRRWDELGPVLMRGDDGCGR